MKTIQTLRERVIIGYLSQHELQTSVSGSYRMEYKIPHLFFFIALVAH